MRYIDPDLKDFLRREDSYTELAVEVTAPDVGQVLRRATDQFFTAPPLVTPTPLTTLVQAARGGLQLAPTTATLATAATGTDATTFALNQDAPSTRLKGLLWTLDRAFTQAALRSFQATIQRTGIFKNIPTDFQLQIYRITKTPGTLQKYDAAKNTYASSALTQYAFTPLLSPAALLKAASITWGGDTGTLNFDLSQFGVVLDNSPAAAAAADQVGELPVYFFVVSPVQPPSQNTFFWVLNTSGATVVASVGTFQRSWWSRANGDDTTPWVAANSADCPRFALAIDTYAASAQAVYLLDLGRAPSAGTVGRIVLEQIVPPGTGVTLEIASAGSGGPWTVVKSGDIMATAQQQYWGRLTLASDASRRATPIVQGFGVEFRTPYDVSDIAITQLPTRDVAPPDCKASIAEAALRLIREGARDFLDLATVIGSQKPTSKLEVDVYLRSRHPLIYADRSKWLRLERLTVDDREPGKTSEGLSLLSIAKKLKVKVPAQVESVNTVHTVTSATATTVQVTPPLAGTSAGGFEYNGRGYYARVRSSAAVTPGYSPTIAGSSGTNELDFLAGVFPTPLAAGDTIEVHSGTLTTSVLKWQDADPADVWYALFLAAGFPAERIGSADLPRSGFPPRVTDFEPGDATAQAKRTVTMQLTDGESTDELLDQLSFIMGGATVERNGQMCFVQIYPGVSAAGAVTVPVAPVAAVFDARDIVAGSLRTTPMIASRKAVVTATYGVNKAAANPAAYPQRVTNASDADAIEWLTQQDLETVGAMDLDDKVTRWFYNTADTGLYLASCVTAQVVRACSTGIRNFPFRVRELYPEVAVGDSVVVITDQYTDYDPSLGVAISGTVAIKGVVVHTASGGRDFSIFVLGLSDNVQRIAGGAAGDSSATDTAPASPTLQLSFDAAGRPIVSVQGAPGTLSMQVAVSKTGAPSDADVSAAAVIPGDQSSFSVGTITCASGETVYARAAAFSRAGALGARSDAATAARTRDTITPISVGIIARGGSVRGNALLRYSAAGGVAPIQLAVAYSTVQNGAPSAYGNVGAAAASPTYDDTIAPSDYETIVVYVQATDATGATNTKTHVIPPIFSPITVVGGQARPRRGAPYDDNNYPAQALDAGGTRFPVSAVDYNSRTIAGMFHKTADDLSAVQDGGGYYKTNQTQRDGGGRAYTGLSGAGRLVTGIDPAADIAGIGASVLSRAQGAGVFSETWDDTSLSEWWAVNGSVPTNLAVNPWGYSAPSYGGRALYVQGESWLAYKRNIPFDPNKLYRLRVKMTVDSYGGGGVPYFYAGVACILGDGVTGKNALGANSYSSSYYLAANGSQPGYNSRAAWLLYEGWFKGTGGTDNSVHAFPTAPCLLAAGTAYIRPLIICNYAGTTTAAVYVDSVEITEYDDNASARTYGALDSNARLVDQRRMPMTRVGNVGSSQGGSTPLSVTWDSTAGQWKAVIAAHSLTVGGAAVAYNSGSVLLDPGYSANYYIYADDPTYAGGAVSYQKTQSPSVVVGAEGRYYVGSVTSGTSGGGGSPPPPSGGGGSGGGCFTAETRVTLADGTERPIATMAVGDAVLAIDAATRTLHPARVRAVHVHDGAALVVLTTEGGATVETTAEHPFLTEHGDTGPQWVRAGDLVPGTRVLRCADGRLCPVAVTQVAHVARAARVYNLTVERWHTYVAGGFAVHNTKMQ